jgi:hypothetical protein
MGTERHVAAERLFHHDRCPDLSYLHFPNPRSSLDLVLARGSSGISYASMLPSVLFTARLDWTTPLARRGTAILSKISPQKKKFWLDEHLNCPGSVLDPRLCKCSQGLLSLPPLATLSTTLPPRLGTRAWTFRLKSPFPAKLPSRLLVNISPIHHPASCE